MKVKKEKKEKEPVANNTTGSTRKPRATKVKKNNVVDTKNNETALETSSE
jgi:hypothetical protein